MLMGEKENESGFYEPYVHFARLLRTWLVGYGIGVPVILLSQQDVSRKVLESGEGQTITLLFLSGVCVQVFAAFIYKYAMGYIYAKEIGLIDKESIRFHLAAFISEAYWLEILFDIVTVISFVCATYIVMDVVLTG
jgi:hypothetical protein